MGSSRQSPLKPVAKASSVPTVGVRSQSIQARPFTASKNDDYDRENHTDRASETRLMNMSVYPPTSKAGESLSSENGRPSFSTAPNDIYLKQKSIEDIEKRIQEITNLLETRSLPENELLALNEEYNHLASKLSKNGATDNKDSHANHQSSTDNNQNQSLNPSFDLGSFSESQLLPPIFMPGAILIPSVTLNGSLTLEKPGDVNLTFGEKGEGIGIAAEEALQDFTRSLSLKTNLADKTATLSNTVGTELTTTGLEVSGPPPTLKFSCAPKPMSFVTEKGWIFSGSMGFTLDLKVIPSDLNDGNFFAKSKGHIELDLKAIVTAVMLTLLGAALVAALRGRSLPNLQESLPSGAYSGGVI